MVNHRRWVKNYPLTGNRWKRAAIRDTRWRAKSKIQKNEKKTQGERDQEASSARFSQQNSLALTGSRGQGSLHKDVEPIISRLGRPVVRDVLTGRVDNPSLVFGDYKLPKSIVSVFIERYINLRKGT